MAERDETVNANTGIEPSLGHSRDLKRDLYRTELQRLSSERERIEGRLIDRYLKKKPVDTDTENMTKLRIKLSRVGIADSLFMQFWNGSSSEKWSDASFRRNF